MGISMLNYADSDIRRDPDAISMKDALTSINPKILRFPGGAEASSYLWATAPTWKPASHAPAFHTGKRWPNNDSKIIQGGAFVDVLNFDAFMELAGNVDVCIVVNFDSMYAPDGPSKQLLIETARQWVRYSKKFKNTFYWEIGNESDMKSTYNGRPENGSQYGRDLIEFAVAMRKERNIKIGMNGHYEDFIGDVLNVAGNHIDFIALHAYPIWGCAGGYAEYATRKRESFSDFYVPFENALNKSTLSKSKKKSIFVMITEMGVVDWGMVNNHMVGWSGNSIGHMIALFDMLGQLATIPKVRGILAWTSHWVEFTKMTSTFELLDQWNELTLIGYALNMWASIGNIKKVTRTETPDTIVFAVSTTLGTRKLIANRSSRDLNMNVLLAYHGDCPESTLVSQSRNVSTLPKYSIAICK
jgi:alpha-L-arabinofuranosidase